MKYHPDKITDRQPTDEDYKFYEKITKAYDVLSTKEEGLFASRNELEMAYFIIFHHFHHISPYFVLFMKGNALGNQGFSRIFKDFQ